MPTKNRREMLSRAVDSVLNQTYPDIELTIVNDGSTFDYLETLAASEGRVTVIHNERSMGTPRARNLAIEQASGKSLDWTTTTFFIRIA